MSGGTSRSRLGFRNRLAGAPITWGVCEIPDWGYALPAERVLGEMASLDLRGTELGSYGFLPAAPEELRALLHGHGLRLVGGFEFLILHDAARAGETLTQAEGAARRLAASGGEVLISAAATGIPDLSGRLDVDAGQWRHMFAMLEHIDAIAQEHGLRHAFHPHAGTLVEIDADVRRVLDGSDVDLCFDTGHLAIGGTDPLALAQKAAGRVGHVHLKDVDLNVAARVRSGTINFRQAVQRGLFRPLGQGHVPVRQIVDALEAAGYQGWYVLEQDTALTAKPSDIERPRADTRASLAYLREPARDPNAE